LGVIQSHSQKQLLSSTNPKTPSPPCFSWFLRQKITHLPLVMKKGSTCFCFVSSSPSPPSLLSHVLELRRSALPGATRCSPSLVGASQPVPPLPVLARQRPWRRAHATPSSPCLWRLPWRHSGGRRARPLRDCGWRASPLHRA
jgi:hypothetical protein